MRWLLYMLKISWSVLIFMMVTCFDSFAQTGRVIDQQINISFQNDSLSTALLRLHNVIQGDFAYDPNIVPKNKFITKTFLKSPVSNILDEILFGTGLIYRTIGGAVVIERKRQKTFTIDGHIVDEESGEEIIGASIYIPEMHIGAISNQYGFYSLTVPEGDYDLVISSIGFVNSLKTVHLTRNLTIDHHLSTRIYALNEISIESNLSDSVSNLPLARSLPTELLNRLPYYAGEVDVIKALQMQSGVKSMSEGSSSLFVRGGNIDQNLITLDEAMIYNPSHLFGLVSVFNSDAIKKIQIYNDQIPANYGGRLSSVVDIRMADGNNKEFHIKGGISLLSMRLAAEGPIKKDVGSFLFTMRRSVIDLLNQDFKIVNPNSSYYDLNLKANYHLSPKNRIFYSFYFGDDRLYSKNSYSNNWGNVTSTFRWNHEFNSRLFFNLSAIYSNYKNLLDVNADTISEKYQWKTGIRDLSLKGDFTFYKSPRSELKFGAITTLHRFIPGEATTAFPDYFNISRDLAWENAAYISHQFSAGKNFQLTYGLRAGHFENGEDRRDVYDASGNKLKIKQYKTYYGLEPRLYLSYLSGSNHRFHAAYNHTYQYLQLIQNNELTYSSLETWMPASAKTKPQRADFWSAGYDYFPGRYKLQLNFYLKKLYNQIDLLNHTQIIKNPLIRDHLRTGSSNAHGTELSISKTTDHLSLSASYTYSRVFRKIKDINNGNRFRANYDVPHEFKSAQSLTVNPHFSFSSFFILSSGRVATLPVGYFLQDGIQVPLFEGRNRSRFPLFHRLDFSAQFNLNTSESREHRDTHVLSAGIYNVYNRKNSLFYRVKQSTDTESDLFESTAGTIPWVAYTFKF